MLVLTDFGPRSFQFVLITIKRVEVHGLMNKKASGFDEFFVATVLADLFDSTGSDDPDFVAQRIVDGLEANGLLNNEELDDDELMAA